MDDQLIYRIVSGKEIEFLGHCVYRWFVVGQSKLLLTAKFTMKLSEIWTNQQQQGFITIANMTRVEQIFNSCHAYKLMNKKLQPQTQPQPQPHDVYEDGWRLRSAQKYCCSEFSFSRIMS